MEKAVTLRRGTPDDAPTVTVLARRLVAFGPPPWRDPEAMIRAAQRRLRAALRSTGADPIILVATVDDEVVGFIHLHSLKDQYRPTRHGHVSDVVVAEGFEGRGIGRRLLAAAEDWAHGLQFDWLTISVFATNHRAADIYEAAGFGRDILRLVKPLR